MAPLLFLGFLLCSVFTSASATADEGPTDPNFVPNEGELENAVSPLNVPHGNYHIVEEDNVYVLNRDTFAFFTMPKKLVMVFFYSPVCDHCRQIQPEFSAAATLLKKHDIPLAKVDITKETELAMEHFVQSFPTILVFQDGVKLLEYDGEKSSTDLANYMLKLNDPNYQPPPSDVIVLSANNFTTFVKEEKLSLIMFYAPWCKHCKQVMPEFEGAATELKSWGIRLAKVDGSQEKELCDQYNIAGWPSFKVFRKGGRLYEYKDGPREKDNMIQYMKDQAKLPSEEKSHHLGIINNLDRREATVVGFFNGKSDLFDEYIVAANEMRGTFKFLHTFSEDVANHFKMPPETVSVFMPEVFWSPYENKTYELTKKSATYKEIMHFILRKSVPLVGQRTKQNEFKYTERPLIVIYYDVNYDHQFVSDTQYVRNKVLEVAKGFVGSNLKFAICNEEEYSEEIKRLGFEDSGEDVNVGCFTEKQKFRMEPVEEFESHHLGEFIENLRIGQAQAYMRSMPVPKEQKGDVKLIVAKNYDDEIHKVKKDAVLFVHAPWCGHCKEFDPVFKKIAKKMSKTNENIIFGKIDGSSNDMPYMFPDIRGFPTLFFISAYEKFDPIMFHGERTYKSVKDWINRHSSIFLTEEERAEQAAEEEEEIESFTSENFEAEIEHKQPDDVPVDDKQREEL